MNYTLIGRAYPRNTGDGLTVILDALPLKGYHIVLLELDEADDRRLLAETRRKNKLKAASDSDSPDQSSLCLSDGMGIRNNIYDHDT